MRKQFDIKYRPQIESGEYKVETRDGKKVRVLCYDANNIVPVVALVTFCDGNELSRDYYSNGTIDYDRENPLDLFIVTPEEELTEFEIRLLDWLSDDTSGEIPIERMKEVVRNRAAELLSLAREQLIKDGYVIEKKAFHDAVENISDKHRAEMSVEYSLHCKIEDGTRHAIMNWEAFQKVAQKFIDIGKAEALKDLPKWRKFAPNINDSFSEQRICKELENSVMRVDVSGYCWVINREELNKLPKESEK